MTQVTKAQIIDLSKSITIPSHSLIDGMKVGADCSDRFEVFSPRNWSVVGSLPNCSDSDIDQAITCARAGFEDGRWSHLPPRARKQAMIRWANLIRDNLLELAVLETIDTGKPIGLD